MFKIDLNFPDFLLESYDPVSGEVGRVGLKDYAGKFLVLFFYPADFTFVCPTELADLSKRAEEFEKHNAKVLVVSTDTVYTHKAWVDAESLLKGFKFQMGADHNGGLSRELGIYDDNNGLAQRAAFIIDPEGVLRAADITSDKIGRSAGEVLRKVKALEFVATHAGKVCPASWDEGAPTLSPSIDLAGKVGDELNKENK